MKSSVDRSKFDWIPAPVSRTSASGIVFFVLLGTALGANAQSRAGSLPKTAFQTCNVVQLDVDDSTDANAVEVFKAGAADLLQNEKFDELDCLADALRSNKTKFASGAWRLHSIYSGVDHPLRHATEEDWKEDLAHLQHWTEIKPLSITARIALARAYVRVQVGKQGVVDNAWSPQPTNAAFCVIQSLAKTHFKEEAVFPAPPGPAYWLRLDVDPAILAVAAK